MVKHPFLNIKANTYDEAVSLIWYLENVFYESFGKIFDYIQQNIFDNYNIQNEIINIAFGQEGDRDGNPFVMPETTLKVAQRLKQTVLKNYYNDLRSLKRKLTFNGVENRINILESKLYNTSINLKSNYAIGIEEFCDELTAIKRVLIEEHQSLYVFELDSLINKVHLFGFYFASLDIRQDSRIHHSVFSNIVDTLIDSGSDIFPKNYQSLSEKEQIKILSFIKGELDISLFKDDLVVNTINTIKAVKSIQNSNGERGSNRYIISNNQTALNVMQLFAMLKLVAFKDKLTVDIVPLFETITDLENAHQVMEELYANKVYKAQLKQRGSSQTIMLGFSMARKMVVTLWQIGEYIKQKNC